VANLKNAPAKSSKKYSEAQSLAAMLEPKYADKVGRVRERRVRFLSPTALEAAQVKLNLAADRAEAPAAASPGKDPASKKRKRGGNDSGESSGGD
jgi:hypothetical protein